MIALKKNALSLTNVLRIMVVMGTTSAVGWAAIDGGILDMLQSRCEIYVYTRRILCDTS
jgi:CII-binding regulator of phage lambda lysogenization HflD